MSCPESLQHLRREQATIISISCSDVFDTSRAVVIRCIKHSTLDRGMLLIYPLFSAHAGMTPWSRGDDGREVWCDLRTVNGD